MIPNILSALRFPLAFLFLWPDPLLRGVAVFLAALTDGLDGYVARKYSSGGRLGVVLDPLADKFFVFFGLVVFFMEGRLAWWEAAAFLSRDIAVALFGAFLWWRGLWHSFAFRSVWSGKLSTTLQLLLFLVLVGGGAVPLWCYGIFFCLGVGMFIELANGEVRRA